MFKKYQILWCDHVVLVNYVFLVVVMAIQPRRKKFNTQNLRKNLWKKSISLIYILLLQRKFI